MTRPFQVGVDRRAVRPDGEVRDRDPHRHRPDRGDPAPVHEGQRRPPDLSGDDRTRPRPEDDLSNRYLRSRELQREIEEGLNVIESWNRANSVIYYGKTGELSSNRADEQELSVQCLRIVQASLIYVNTLMIQDLIDDPDTGDILITAADKRGCDPTALGTRPALRRGQAQHDQLAHPQRKLTEVRERSIPFCGGGGLHGGGAARATGRSRSCTPRKKG
ncbi:Tn3 family transposase [Nocardia vinacea]|uniref:Tn3 family transposase n=1 Tax=Nocardia vinacea TaxID=96468 RepID=UPI003F4DC0B0